MSVKDKIVFPEITLFLVYATENKGCYILYEENYLSLQKKKKKKPHNIKCVCVWNKSTRIVE